MGQWSSFYSKIAGVSHSNPDGTSRQSIIPNCYIGEELILVREPHNPYGSHAIRIERRNGQQLGYVTAYTADSHLARDLDRGFIVRCRIAELTGGTHDKPTRGINIEIFQWDGTDTPNREPFAAPKPQYARGEPEPKVGMLVCIVIAVILLTYFLTR